MIIVKADRQPKIVSNIPVNIPWENKKELKGILTKENMISKNTVGRKKEMILLSVFCSI